MRFGTYSSHMTGQDSPLVVKTDKFSYGPLRYMYMYRITCINDYHSVMNIIPTHTYCTSVHVHVQMYSMCAWDNRVIIIVVESLKSVHYQLV